MQAMAARLCSRNCLLSRAFLQRKYCLPVASGAAKNPTSLLLCKGFNPDAVYKGTPYIYESRWTMQMLPSPWMLPSLRFSTESEKKKKKKKKKKKSKRDIIKKLKHLRHVTKVKKASMDHEHKLLARIERAKKKIDALQKALEPYQLPPLPPVEHDPESLTAEELHYLKRLGYKHKNYMLIGVRGVFGGVVLNMHLHWKKHQLVKIRCKSYTKEEIEETGRQLARLSGGIVVDVQKGDTIVMYRGRNYTRPAELTPKNTLTKRKALFKARFEQSLKSTNKNLLALEKELVLYREHKAKEEAGLYSREPEKSYLSSWSDTDDEHDSDSEKIEVDESLVSDSDFVLDTDPESSSESEEQTKPAENNISNSDSEEIEVDESLMSDSDSVLDTDPESISDSEEETKPAKNHFSNSWSTDDDSVQYSDSEEVHISSVSEEPKKAHRESF